MEAMDIALQPDGKIVVTGGFSGNHAAGNLVARYDTYGNLDKTFGSAGTGLVQDAGVKQANAIAVQPDGKILVAGNCDPRLETYPQRTPTNPDCLLSRYTADGKLDTSFNSKGYVTTPVSLIETGTDGAESCTHLLLQPDGKIVVSGKYNDTSSGGYVSFVARYQPTGQLDTSFGTDQTGIVKLQPVSKMSSYIDHIALDRSGDIIAGGYTFIDPNTANSVVMRLDTTGVVTGFREWNVVTDFDNSARVVAIQPDGKILLGANQRINSPPAFTRLNPDFTTDTSFGTNGVTVLTSNLGCVPTDMAVVSGNIVFIGHGYENTYPLHSVIGRLTPNGQLDPTFKNGGIAVYDFSTTQEGCTALAVQPDGKVLSAGYVYIPKSIAIVVARYLGDPTPAAPSTAMPSRNVIPTASAAAPAPVVSPWVLDQAIDAIRPAGTESATDVTVSSLVRPRQRRWGWAGGSPTARAENASISTEPGSESPGWPGSRWPAGPRA
jgi:uncharacterized delta-60 repeat protein